MRARAAILSSLSGIAGISIALTQSGCWLLWQCPKGSDFDGSYDITAEKLEDLVQYGLDGFPGGTETSFTGGFGDGDGDTGDTGSTGDVGSTGDGDSGNTGGDGDGDGDGDVYASPNDISCETFCKALVPKDRFDWVSVDTCTHDISAYVEGTSTGAEVVGSVTCTGTVTPECTGGRRPLGFVEPTLDDHDVTTRWLLGGAHLEAASVVAFEQLADDLARWGAPADLVQRCRDAADDEREHARMMGGLAEARGAEVPPLRQAEHSRGLLDAALHNAVEGCVTETWSALLACHQAVFAQDADVRRVYEMIAADETRHAELAWDLHTWLSERLSDTQRAQVERARNDALRRLPELALAQGNSRSAALGLPGPGRAVALARDLASRLAA